MAPTGPVAVAVRLEGSDRTGAFRSILIVTETELERPTLLVTEHVRVVPAVSAVRWDSVQPVEDRIPDSDSCTDQITVTSLIYQPPEPAVPIIVGVMTGAVVSRTNVSLEQ